VIDFCAIDATVQQPLLLNSDNSGASMEQKLMITGAQWRVVAYATVVTV
jgi:hypothetical protein